MQQHVFPGLIARSSENIPYLWVIYNGPLTSEGFRYALSNVSFLTWLADNCNGKLLLDMSKSDYFSIPEMSDFMEQKFIPAIGEMGFQKIAVLVTERILAMLGFVFQGLELAFNDKLTNIHFFEGSQFHNSPQVLDWFCAPEVFLTNP